MRVTSSLLIGSCFVLIVLSCKKSNHSSTPSNVISGNYKFVNMNAQTTVTEQQAGGITAVATANYITQNNSGMITFTTDSMTVNGLAYTVDTVVYTSFYLNGSVYAKDSSDFTATLPATSTTQGYTLVSKDSLYFPNGGLIPAGLTSTSEGDGAHFVITGDTLKLYTQASDTTNGQIQAGTAIITLLKQ